jgi:ketosteroid isomerase-like protein
MSDTMEVAKKLVDLCKQGKFMDAVNAHYAPNIVSIEPQAGPNAPARQEGINAIREKTTGFEKTHTIHSCKVEGPWPHGDRFIVRFTLDVTPKVGPMANKRFTMDETGLYTVKDGKVVHEEFFYHMG